MYIERVALGRFGALGNLYDAHTDTILPLALFKRTIPTEAIQSTKVHSGNYELTTNDSFEEKFSRLKVSAELTASVLSGMVALRGSGSYLSDAKTSVQIQQASLIRDWTTQIERLNFNHNVLKEIADFQRLKLDGVTHVISEIVWGARYVITAKSTRSDAINATEPRGELSNSSKGKESHEYGVIELLKSITEAHIQGNLESVNHFKTASSPFEFKINTDIVYEKTFAINYDGVCKFIEGFPAAIQQSNGGRGVPLYYLLLPVQQVAQIFDIKIEANHLLKQVDEDCLRRFVELFDAFSITRQRLNDYSHRLDNHNFCVPKSHRKATEEVINDTKNAEYRLKSEFCNTLKNVRTGEKEMNALWDILKKYGFRTNTSDEESPLFANSPDKYLSILSKFREKINFVDKLKSMGAKYVPNTAEYTDNIFTEGLIDDVYVLYFSESARSHPEWANTRNTLVDLLLDMDREDPKYSVVVIDCDMATVRQEKLDKPLLQKLRGKEVIVNDVVRATEARFNLQQLEVFATSEDPMKIFKKNLPDFVSPPPKVVCPQTSLLEATLHEENDHKMPLESCDKLLRSGDDKLSSSRVNDDAHIGLIVPSAYNSEAEERLPLLSLERNGETAGMAENGWSTISVSSVSTIYEYGKTLINKISSGLTYPMRVLKYHLEILAWPALQPGRARVTWRCRCGQRLYRDVPEDRQEEGMRFAKAAAGSENESTVQIVLSTSTQSSNSNATEGNFSRQRNSSLPSSMGVSQSSPGGVNSSASNPPMSEQLVLDRKKRFLLLCVNTAMYRAELSNVDLTGVICDEKLFGRVREAYNSKKCERYFMTPKYMEYVKFRLVWRQISGECIGAMRIGQIPPKEEVSASRYHYYPCPLDEDMKYPSHLFMHSFNNLGDHTGREALHELPKKLKDQLQYSRNQLDPTSHDPVVGWGIYIVEGRDWTVITWAFSIGLAISVAITIIYWTVKNDIQGATGLGALGVAITAFYIGLVSMSWDLDINKGALV